MANTMMGWRVSFATKTSLNRPKYQENLLYKSFHLEDALIPSTVCRKSIDVACFLYQEQVGRYMIYLTKNYLSNLDRIRI